MWCSLHDSSDESDSSAAASPLTTAVPSGAVVSLFDTLDAPDPAHRAEQVATHQEFLMNRSFISTLMSWIVHPFAPLSFNRDAISSNLRMGIS